MPKQKTLYPFNQCITESSPYATTGSKDFIVIYAVKDGDEGYHEDSIIFGYLDTAERIIKSLYSNDHAGDRPHAGDDRVSLPLLHLYSHALELSLKSSIITLISHGVNCKRLNKSYDEGAVDRVMSSHSLGD